MICLSEFPDMRNIHNWNADDFAEANRKSVAKQIRKARKQLGMDMVPVLPDHDILVAQAARAAKPAAKAISASPVPERPDPGREGRKITVASFGFENKRPWQRRWDLT